jgi:hypothetical protein
MGDWQLIVTLAAVSMGSFAVGIPRWRRRRVRHVAVALSLTVVLSATSCSPLVTMTYEDEFIRVQIGRRWSIHRVALPPIAEAVESLDVARYEISGPGGERIYLLLAATSATVGDPSCSAILESTVAKYSSVGRTWRVESRADLQVAFGEVKSSIESFRIGGDSVDVESDGIFFCSHVMRNTDGAQAQVIAHAPLSHQGIIGRAIQLALSSLSLKEGCCKSDVAPPLS